MPMPVPGRDFDEAEHPAVPGDHPVIAKVKSLFGATPAQWGLDYAWQSDTPDQLVRLLLSNRADFVCRYINDAVSGGKGITPAEAAALEAAGIIIGPVFETSGTDFTGGYAAGLAAGQRALPLLRARGAGPGAYCWFAIDTDTSDYASTNAYLRGAKAATAEYIAQLYGKYGVVEAAYAAGLGDRHWQTYAWSGGNLSSHAAIYQYQNGVMIGGISMDRDRTLQPMRGPWASFGSVPAPPPAPAPPQFPYPAADYLGLQSADPHCHSGFSAADQPHIRAWQQQMAHRGWPVTVDGLFGTQSYMVCTQFQSEKGLAADGKVGPVTWAETWKAPVT